jgi:hypothetical protein
MLKKNSLTIFILSGGVGASAEQVVQTVLAQFPGQQVPVALIANIRQEDQLASAVARAAEQGGVIVHTLVDSRLRQALIRLAAQAGVPAIDLMGDLIEHLTRRLGVAPLEHPGLYRQLNRAYYERVSAIDFAMAHDDGKNPEDWPQADMLLLGVSRAGKTPISLYLSVLGWKAANLPLVPELSIPAQLETLDPRRVFGLHIEAGQLLLHRQIRQSRLGVTKASPYTDPQVVYEEVENTRRFFQRSGFTIIDVTDKPIESCADEIIRLISALPADRA